MKFMVMIYADPALIDALPAGEYDAMMRGCLEHAEELRVQGRVLDSQQLEPPATGKTVRVRGGRTSVVDGPFAETKEILGGYNIVEAADMDEALRIAQEFPWARVGCIEVRPVRDFAAVRRSHGLA
jgi:hypothetical protein